MGQNSKLAMYVKAARMDKRRQFETTMEAHTGRDVAMVSLAAYKYKGSWPLPLLSSVAMPE
eukprot:3368800-Pleurochrysis_carterae.AAC.1